MRLYNPLPGIPKYTGQQPTHLDVNGNSYRIPEDTLVIPSLQALHTDPRNWGQDSLEWRPQRWIANPNVNDQSSPEAEELVEPVRGTYFPWAEGARNCPGKKFAQVEFVAVLVALLGNHVAEPIPWSGESMEQARQRTLAVVKDSSVELLLQMRNPRSVSVRWKERRNDAS